MRFGIVWKLLLAAMSSVTLVASLPTSPCTELESVDNCGPIEAVQSCNMTFAGVPICRCNVGWFSASSITGDDTRPCVSNSFTRPCNDLERLDYCDPSGTCSMTCTYVGQNSPYSCLYSNTSCFTNGPHKGVIPGHAELTRICGNAVLPTATFNCFNYTNRLGYFGCVNDTQKCACLPNAPIAFQSPGQPPCTQTTQIVACSPSDIPKFCGNHAVGCSKRCDFKGNCYQVEECQCQTGFGRIVGNSYCGNVFEADVCLLPDSIPDRQITNCGVFTQQAYFDCPVGNTTSGFNPALCVPVCLCIPGSGQTPGSDVQCDGQDVACGSDDVSVLCPPLSSGFLYTACTKRCQYTNSNPVAQKLCVLLPESCSVTAGLVVGPCTAAAAGPALISCTQQYLDGVSYGEPSPICNGTGFPSSSFLCDEWALTTVIPTSECYSKCGDGLLTDTPCLARRFIVPFGVDPFPFLLEQGFLSFNEQTLTYQDNIDQVRAFSRLNGRNTLNTEFWATQCRCDSTALISGAHQIQAALSRFDPTNRGLEMYENGATGSLSPWRFYTKGTPGNVPVLDLSPRGYTIYAGNSAPVNFFYRADRCDRMLHTSIEISGFSLSSNVTGPTENDFFSNTPPVNLVDYDPNDDSRYMIKFYFRELAVFGAIPFISPGVNRIPIQPTDFQVTDATGIRLEKIGFGANPSYVMTLSNGWAFEIPNDQTPALNLLSDNWGNNVQDLSVFPVSIATYLSLGNAFMFDGSYNGRICAGRGDPILASNTYSDLCGANGDSPEYRYIRSPFDDTRRGPSVMVHGRVSSCNCFDGWSVAAGSPSSCTINTCCNPTRTPLGQPTDCLPAGATCPITGVCKFTFNPNLSTPCKLLFQWDALTNYPNYIIGSQCPLNLACNIKNYDIVAQQYCANGFAQYSKFELICLCNPGWESDPSSGRCTVPSANNCPTFVPSLNITKPCGGHGTIDASGFCVCDSGWAISTTSCCTISVACSGNQCPSTHCCSSTTSHIFQCVNGVNQCFGSSGGYWNGTCCDQFVFDTPCVHGSVSTGQLIYSTNANSTNRTPVVFPASGTTENPNDAYCACDNNAFTGLQCNISSCPVLNGTACSGHGICRNGDCQTSQGICAIDSSYGGCACQFNLAQQCKVSKSDPFLCSSPSAGSCIPLQQANSIDFSCQCNGRYSGQFCQISPCGLTNCNAANSGGTCNIPTNISEPTFCTCRTQNDFCLSGTNCLFAGPTCDLDVTQACGNHFSSFGWDTCDGPLHGSCNTSVGNSSSSWFCQCNNAYQTASPGHSPFCTVEPCVPHCGDHGNCMLPGPKCKCDDHWFTPPDGDPCTANDCSFGGFPDESRTPPVCVCNDTSKSYATQCTGLDCPYANGLVCGSVHCLFNTECIASGGGCLANCPSPPNPPINPNPRGTRNTCNSTAYSSNCVCHWSSILNVDTGVCDLRCSPNNTVEIISNGLVPPSFGACRCSPGWDFATGCFERTCKNGGTFNNGPVPSCSCPPGTIGAQCEEVACDRHGTYNYTNQSCTCFAPFVGPNCESNLCEHEGFPQQTGQTASDYQCVCPFAYYGSLCQFDTCAPNGAPNQALDGCDCSAEWSGSTCLIFACEPPNTNNGTACICDSQYYGVNCRYRKCGQYGTSIDGQCACAGVTSKDSNGNCTLNTCGPHGIPSDNFETCICDDGTYFNPFITPDVSFNCIPNCINGGVYNNTDATCSCPPGTFPPDCEFPPPLPSSSTGGNGPSSTGSHRNSAAQAANLHLTFHLFLTATLAFAFPAATNIR